MQKLSLNGIEIEASHGVYSSEKKTLNKFEVNIDLWANYTKAMKSDELDDTLDYQEVHEIVKEEMDIPSDLIENVCYRIAHRIAEIDFEVKKILVSIKKKNPPLDGFVKSTEFEFILTR